MSFVVVVVVDVVGVVVIVVDVVVVFVFVVVVVVVAVIVVVVVVVVIVLFACWSLMFQCNCSCLTDHNSIFKILLCRASRLVTNMYNTKTNVTYSNLFKVVPFALSFASNFRFVTH